jgi:hypothetical protein
MSVHVISWVLQQSQARLGDRLVLLVLADHARADGTAAWPAVETIAREARLSERQVQRCLRKLEDDKRIRPTGKSKDGTTAYTVVMKEGRHIVGATSSAGNVSQMSPEPSLEPSKTSRAPSAHSLVRQAWEAAPGMVRHKDGYYGDGKVRSAIDRAVKKHGVEDVVAAVGLYAEVVRSPDTTWSHRWPLREFLERGVDRFVPEADPKSVYRSRRRNGKAELTDQERAELQVYNKA